VGAQVATSRPPISPARTGIWIGIAAITMSFAALTSALVVRQGAGSDWEHFQLPPILFFNTLLLLASSVTLQRTRSRMAAVPTEEAAGAAGLPWLYLTMGLGLLFVTGQVLAWRSLAAQGLFLATSPNSAFFYVFTAVHALHVLGGLVGLSYAVVRLHRRADAASREVLGTAAVYWHFMDGLWLYLLLVLAVRV
jgi:cytochrome c oxidase subunit 3